MTKLKSLSLSLIFLLFLASCNQSHGNNTPNSSNQETTTSNNQEKTIKNSAGVPTYVFYYAKWCKFCKKMAPEIAQAQESYKDEIFFYMVDVDSEEQKGFVQEFKGKEGGIPQSQLYDESGKMIKSRLGLMNYPQIQNFILVNLGLTGAQQ